jgi:type VI secretion system lysozyme-like protein
MTIVGIPEEIPSKRYYNRFELMQSIQDELSRIINTRAGIKKTDYDQLASNPKNFALPQMYGLSDFSQYDATAKGAYPRIAKLCENAIRMYEPRLKNPVVTITGFTPHPACGDLLYGRSVRCQAKTRFCN